MSDYHKSLYGELNNTIDEDGIVAGYYGSDSVDVEGHIIFREDFIAKFQEYMAWGNVRDNHQQPVGVLHSYDPNNWNHFVVKLFDSDLIQKTKNRVYKGFSVGIKVDESGLIRVPLSQIPEDKYSHLPEAVIKRLKRVGYVMRIKDFYIFEISITDRPKNTKARITYIKSEGDNSNVLPSLTEESMNDVNEEIVAEVTPTEEIVVEKSESVTKDAVIIEVAKADVAPEEEDEEKVEDTEAESKEDESEVVVEKSDVIVEDVNKAFQDTVMVALSELSTKIAAIQESVSGALTVLNMIKSEGGSTSQDVAVAKSELATEKPSTDEIKALISDTVKESLAEFSKGEFSIERRGAVNVGEQPEKVEKFDVTNMSKADAYGVMAGIIARSIKK